MLQQIFASVTPNFTDEVKSSSKHCYAAILCLLLTVCCVVAANIAQSPSFATKGSWTVEDLEEATVPLARSRWKRAIEQQIVAIQLQKNSEELCVVCMYTTWWRFISYSTVVLYMYCI